MELDVDMLLGRIRDVEGCTLLFDFEAAFPSVAHDFLFEALEHIGLPKGFVQAVKYLHENNDHHMCIKGEKFQSFSLQSGVRQGCPLSPSLFVIVIDLFLVSLQDSCPFGSVRIRAFADDIGISVWRINDVWPILVK